MNWNTDISQAPRGKMVETTVQTAKGQRMASRFVPTRVILATKCGKVVLSQYLPDDERWQMLGKGEEPLAWFAWPDFPSHLFASSKAFRSPAMTPLPSSGQPSEAQP